MIGFLQGKIVEALPTQVVLDVHGVGYEVLIPLSSFERLPPVGQEVRLLTHLSVREDAHVLFGFATAGERTLFRLLIRTITGIGPKSALSILSGISVATFYDAVSSGDVKRLSGISGVGKKTAERIVVELKDKLGEWGGGSGAAASTSVPAAGQTAHDAALALEALGYKPKDAQDAVRAAVAVLGAAATVDRLVRAALQKSA
ncbi:MAG: Holliday junction branch migration protein RuvA [Pedosphaera sp.]|nr:Holliday junction branch migration protein RuvA [Pedosphaera sp.]